MEQRGGSQIIFLCLKNLSPKRKIIVCLLVICLFKDASQSREVATCPGERRGKYLCGVKKSNLAVLEQTKGCEQMSSLLRLCCDSILHLKGPSYIWCSIQKQSFLTSTHSKKRNSMYLLLILLIYILPFDVQHTRSTALKGCFPPPFVLDTIVCKNKK